MGFTTILKEIYNFLKSFSHIISDADKTKLVNIQSQLEHLDSMKLIKSKYGEHFEDCCWSHESTTCGPDTCSCSYQKIRRQQVENEARNIINFYYLIKCRNCAFNKS